MGFQGQYSVANVAFCSYVVAYYIQDTLISFHELSPLIIGHHIGSALLVVCCLATNGWRGLSITMGVLYESGSLCMGLVDLDLVPRSMGPSIMIATTLAGIGVVIHGLIASPPPDAFGVCAAVLVLLGGIGRLQQ